MADLNPLFVHPATMLLVMGLGRFLSLYVGQRGTCSCVCCGFGQRWRCVLGWPCGCWAEGSGCRFSRRQSLFVCWRRCIRRGPHIFGARPPFFLDGGMARMSRGYITCLKVHMLSLQIHFWYNECTSHLGSFHQRRMSYTIVAQGWNQFCANRVYGTKIKTGSWCSSGVDASYHLVPNQTIMIIYFANIFFPRAVVVSLLMYTTSIRSFGEFCAKMQ